MEPEFNKQHFRRSNVKALTEIKATPVILVCIYNHNNTLITHDLLKTIFSQYGNVLRILIFEKVKVWKAFIEYSTLESAYEAKRNLNDFMIFTDGTRMNVYFSNLDSIKFQNNNSGGVDYTLPPETQTQDLQIIQNPTVILQRPEVVGKTLSSQNDQTPPFNFVGQNEVEHIPQNFQSIIRPEFSQSPPFVEEKTEDIFKSIKTQQQQQQPEKVVQQEDEEKQQEEIEDKNRISFNQDLLSKAFMGRTNSRNFDDEQPFDRRMFVRNPKREITAPPGLVGYQPQNQNLNMSPNYLLNRQADQRRVLPSPGSFHLLSQNPSPPKLVQAYKPSSISDIPRNVHNPVIQYEKGPSFVINNPSNFAPYSQIGMSQGKISHNRTSSLVVEPQTHSSHELSELNQDTTSYQSLFDLIDSEIHAELNNKMKSLDLNSDQSVNMSYGIGFENGEEKKSQMLYVKGLEDRDIAIQMIYNLFSNFGNVLKVIFMRSKAAALLEYENSEYATIAKDYLNNIILLKKPLRIFFSNYSIINLRNKKTSPLEEIYIGNPKTFRFKKNKNISINPPSATLHISNLAAEVANEGDIQNFFGMYGTILALKFLLIDNTKHQCLMKLSSIEESINIMAILHDGEFGGRRVQLSFTRSKI